MIEKKYLKVATLNYSGIITSPYEYHEQESEDEQKINHTFIEMVKKYHEGGEYFDDPGKFKWEMGNIDVKWKERFSPVNIESCGVKYDGFTRIMMNIK